MASTRKTPLGTLRLVRPGRGTDAALGPPASGNPKGAVAPPAKRAHVGPCDFALRGNHAIALYEAECWTEAADAFGDLVAEVGPADLRAVPMTFSIGYCLLQLGDPWGSLMATTTFLQHSNERHPFYADALENTACAWEALGAVAEATTLRCAQELRAQPSAAKTYLPSAKRLWPRRMVIATSLRILGSDQKPRASRRCRWLGAE